MKKKGFKSIRLEMVFNICALSIVICIAFFAISMSQSQSAVSGLLDDSLSEITSQGATLISDRVSTIHEKLRIIASSEMFLSSEISNTRLFALFNNVQEASGGNMDLAFAGPDGIAYSTGGRQFSVVESENFIRGIAGESYTSDPIPTGSDGEMTMMYSVPVYNRDDEVRGVLFRICDGYELCDLIADLSLAETGYAFVINSAGVILAHPNQSMVASQDPILENALETPEEAELGEMLSRMIQGESGVYEYTYEEERKNAGYAPIQGTNWYLALTAPHDEVFAVTNRLQVILAGATILLALISAAAALFIANRIHKPLLNLEKAAKKFSAGDLDVDISVRRRDEIGVLAQALGSVADNMTKIISGIRSGAEQVAVESKEIANSGQQFAQGTAEQASALEQITASVEQIAAQTRTNAENANEANALAASTRGMAKRGNGKMDNLLNAMKDIDHSSGDIVRIIKVIDDIAFQTNILALNAAVEAAHAGQHGRGFAVVAQEVRNLAAKSAEAAKETANLIQNSSKKVAGGVQLAEETADALVKIVKEISRVAALVNEISVASGEQSMGIEQINQGLSQVSQVVQANSTASQQNAAVSQHLTTQVDMLNREVAGFHLRSAGATTSPSAVVQKNEPQIANVPTGRKKRKKRKERAVRGERVLVKKRKEGKRFGFLPSKKIRSTATPPEEDAPPIKPPMPAEISLDAEIESPAPNAHPQKVSLSDREFGKY